MVYLLNLLNLFCLLFSFLATSFSSTGHSSILFSYIPNSGHNLLKYQLSIPPYHSALLDLIQTSNSLIFPFSPKYSLLLISLPFINNSDSKTHHFSYYHLLIYLPVYLPIHFLSCFRKNFT